MPNEVLIKGFGTITFPDDTSEEEMLRVINDQVPRAQKSQKLRSELESRKSGLSLNESPKFAGAVEFLDDVNPIRRLAELPRQIVQAPWNLSKVIGTIPEDQPPPSFPRAQGDDWKAGALNVAGTVGNILPEIPAYVAGGPPLLATIPGEIIKHLPEQAQQAGEASVVGTPAEKVEAYSNLALSGAVAAAPIVHATLPAEVSALRRGVGGAIRSPLTAVDALRRADMIEQAKAAAQDRIVRESFDPSRAQVVVPPVDLIGPVPSSIKVPRRIETPVVPETPSQPNVPVLQEIRSAKADTVSAVQKLFPRANLTREQARALRNQAFPETAQPKEKQDALQEQQAASLYEALRNPPRKGKGEVSTSPSIERVQRGKPTEEQPKAGEVPLEQQAIADRITEAETAFLKSRNNSPKATDFLFRLQSEASKKQLSDVEYLAALKKLNEGPDGSKGQGIPVEPVKPSEVGPEPVAPKPKGKTKASKEEVEESPAIRWLIDNKIKIRGKGTMLPGQEGYYTETYLDAVRTHFGRQIFSNKRGARNIDEVIDDMRRDGVMPEGATVNDLVEIIGSRQSAKRAQQAKLETEAKLLSQEEQVLIDFQKATAGDRAKGEPKAGDTIIADDLLEGDKFKLAGEEVTVDRIVTDPETGEITSIILDDGQRFGTQRIGPNTTIVADKGSVERVKAPDFLEPEPAKPLELESVTSEQLKSEAEAKAEAEQKAKQQEEIADRAAGPMKGSSKDVGQGKLFAEDKDLFSGETAEELTGMGAAVPSEFKPKGLSPTGLKQAEIESNRIKRGLDPILRPERQRTPELYDKVIGMLDRDSEWPVRLLNELEANPRVITPEEHLALLHHYADLRNEYYKSLEREQIAIEDGRKADAEVEAVMTTMWSNRMARMELIADRAGTAAGRSLAIRRTMMNDDFSLATLEMQMRRDRGEGYEVTPEDRTMLQGFVDRFQKKSKELEDRINKYSAAKRERDLDKGIQSIKQWAAKEKKKRAAKDVPLDKRIADAESRLRKAFESGNQSAIGALAKRLERYFYEAGIRHRDALVDAVHNVLRGIDRTWTRTKTIDAMNGYGQFELLTHDEISDGIREINGQLLQIRKLQDMAAGKPPLKTGHERAEPGPEQRRLIKLVNEAKRRFQVPVTDPATQLKSSLDTLKTRMRNQIQDFEDMLKKGDYELRKRREPIERDADADRLQIELDNIKHDWAKKRFLWQKENWDLVQKAIYWTSNIIGVHRGILTSMEMSALLRQGKPYFFAHPTKHISAIPDSLRALKSEAGRQQVDLEIRQRPNFRFYNRDKLYLAEHGVQLSKLEESFRSNLIQESKLLKPIAISERAYTTFLNRIRADWYDALSDKLTKGMRETTPEEGALIANAVNVMTGRGSVPMMETAMGDLANVFFAPRYVASRFQMALGSPIWSRSVPWKGTGEVRALIAKEYARAFSGAAAYYGLVMMGLAMLGGKGIKLNLTNPSSTDWGKIVVGNTRIDPLAGIAQVVVLLDREFTGNYTDQKGKRRKLEGKEYLDVVTRWLRQKLGPTVSLAISLRTGENAVGQKQSVAEMLSEQIVPITYQGMLDLMEDQGIPRGMAIMILAFLGEGVNTYEKK